MQPEKNKMMLAVLFAFIFRKLQGKCPFASDGKINPHFLPHNLDPLSDVINVLWYVNNSIVQGASGSKPHQIFFKEDKGINYKNLKVKFIPLSIISKSNLNETLDLTKGAFGGVAQKPFVHV